MSIDVAQDQAGARSRMLAEIAEDFRATAGLTGCAAMSPAVAAALGSVPRHEFVRATDRARAYANRPLSIGRGQTISQPFIVALMTELARLSPQDKVLEIGTGCGYQAAVLAQLVDTVYSIEVVAPLAEKARARLARLGLRNVVLRSGDGSLGWPEAAPFDAILVTAGGRLPPALFEQLKPGGRLVIPLTVGPGEQELFVITRDSDGGALRRAVLPVRFVPLTGAD